MKFGIYPPMPISNGLPQLPAWYYNPPVGSDWYKIINAWDGVPDSALPHLLLSNNYDVSGWRADCSAAQTTPGNLDMRTNVGESVNAGYSGPYMITAISNQELTQYIRPNADGTLTGTSSGGRNINALGQVIVAGLAVAGAAIVGAAVAAGSAASVTGSTAATVADTGTTGATIADTGTLATDTTNAVTALTQQDIINAGINLAPGYTAADLQAALDAATMVGGTVPSAILANDTTNAVTALTQQDIVNAGINLTPGYTAGDLQAALDAVVNAAPYSLADDLTNAVKPLTAQDIASAGANLPSGYTAADLQAALDAAGGISATSLLSDARTAGSVARGVGTIGKIVGAIQSAIGGGARAAGGGAGGLPSGNGIRSGQFGQTSPGAMSALVLAGFAILLLSGKRK